MLQATGFLSVNQTAAYSLMLELWKGREFEVPILGSLLGKRRNDERTLRSDTTNKQTAVANDTLSLTCEKLWNMAPHKFKTTNLLTVAKMEAKRFVRTLPI